LRGWGQNAALNPGNIVACNTTIYDRGGTGNYSNSTDEWITIAGRPGATITISGSYALETGGNYDYIYIRDGYGNSGTVLQTKVNSTGTISYTGTSGQTLTVHLTSDGSTVASGFSLTVTYSTSQTCPTYYSVSGTTSTVSCGSNAIIKDHAGDNASYSNSRNDYIVFNNVASSTAQINIIGRYALESGCNCDYIRIYEGAGISGTVLATYTNGSGLINYTGSAGKVLTVRFTSDGGSVDGGFALFASYTGSCAALPYITISSSLTAFSACANTASTSQSFTVSGTDMQAGITATAPTGFQISTDNINFYSSVNFGAAGTINATTLYARMSALASSPASGSISFSSTNAITQNISVSGTIHTKPTMGTLTVNGNSNNGDVITVCPGQTISVSQSGFNNQGGITYFYSDNTTAFGGWSVAPDWEIMSYGSITSANQVSGQNNVNNLTSFNYKINSTGIYILHANAHINSCYGDGTNRYISVAEPPGDQSSYGSNSWIGYVYNSSSAGSFSNYRGYVTENENFDRDMSTGTPSGATTNICLANSDLFATRYKMTKSYTAGVYTFTVGADDGVRLSVDGGATWLINDWTDHGYRTLTGSAYLSGSTNLVLEYYENSSGARVSVSSSMASPVNMQVPAGFTNSVKYTTCSGTFYDTGGSGSSYSNDENYTVTFYPSTSGGKARLTFTSFSTESGYDYFYIYNGNSTGASLIGTYDGTNSPGTVTSTASDGSLTIRFYSDGSTTSSGWAATVSCYTPDYITQWVTMNVGSSDWCTGESRQVTVTIKNNGLQPWTDGSGVDFNIGVKWNAESDYFVRVDAQNLAAGATATYSLTITAPSTTGSNNLTFDVVRESCFWFASNGTACGYNAGPGNTVYASSALNIKTSPSNVNAGSDVSVCIGANTTLNGSTTSPITIFSENFESYTAGTLPGSGNSWKQTEITSTVTYWQINTSCVPPQGSKCLNMNDSYGFSYSECDYAWDDSGDEIAWYGTLINASGFSNLKMNFNWRAYGELDDGLNGGQPYDYGYVVYSTNGTTWTNVSSTKYFGQTSWQTVSNLSLPAGLNGQSFYIGFRWINDGATGTVPGFNIDNISITGETPLTYAWSPTSSLSSSTILNPIATPTATTTYTLTITGNGCTATDNVTLNVNNPAPSTSIASTDYVWRGVTNSDWNTASNWVTFNGSTYSAANAAPTATSTPNVIIPATSTNCPVSNFPNTGSSTVYGKNVTIEPSASVTMGNGIMNVSGNFTNNGTFTCGTGTVNFNGTSTQTINTSNTRETFYNLTTDKSAGQLQLNDSVQVNNLLTLTNGKINTTSANLLTLLINATYNASTTIGSASSYVNGPMAYKISSTTVQNLKFPLGNTNDWRPVEVNVTHNSTTPYTYTAQMYNGSANALGWTLPTGFERVSHVHYVDVERIPSSTNNLSAATIKMYYSNTNGTDDGVSNYQNLSIAKASISGSVWSDIGGLGTATANSVGSITSNNFTSFSRFSLSNKSGGTNPLPVELTDFTAACKNQQVKLNWTTQSELNNDYFGVERSADGLLFHEIGRVAGHGNSNVVNHYQYFDEQALASTSYYRLNQVDFNGDSKIYPVKVTSCDDEQHEIIIYPNPNSGDFEISGLSEGNCIDVFDVLGKKVISTLSKSAKEKLQLTGIKPGVYFVVIKNASGEINTQKILIEL
jgi:hypothetical protein